jgi:ribonuclease Y
MSEQLLLYLVLAVAVGLGGFIAYNRHKLFDQATKDGLGISEAEAKAREILLEAKDEALKIKHEAEDTARKQQQEVLELERKVQQKQESIDQHLQRIQQQQEDLAQQSKKLDQQLQAADDLKSQQLAELEKVAKLSQEEAKKRILEELDAALSDEKARHIKVIEDEIKVQADDKAKEILIDAMRHGATDYVSEHTTSSVKLQDEDVKGRIIGKEGRNIKAFEMATGVDVDVDETPGVIRLSSFDGVRREIARLSL